MRAKETTYIRDPAEDVRMEAHVVLRDVQPALDEDLALERASVVCNTCISDRCTAMHERGATTTTAATTTRTGTKTMGKRSRVRELDPKDASRRKCGMTHV